MRRQNILLTIWVLTPVLLAGLLFFWIVTSLQSNRTKMRPLGPGASDTGGANAIGEWLAGNDPDQIQRTNKALREGTLVDPLTWPGGIRFEIAPGLVPHEEMPVLKVWQGPGRGASMMMFTLDADMGFTAYISHDDIRELFRAESPQAGLYLSLGGLAIEDDRISSTDGSPIRKLNLPPIPPADTQPHEPIVVELTKADLP